MPEFMRSLAPILVPVFVIPTMLNVGLTQTLAEILGSLSNRSFVLKKLLANVIAAPLVMIVILKILSLDPALEAGCSSSACVPARRFSSS